MRTYIIMPAYNEERRIGKTLEEYGKFFSNKKFKSCVEIIIVLNACRDNTLNIVKKYQRRYKIIKYLNFKEGGKGFAIIQGFKYAINKSVDEKDLIGFVDADLATSPEEFYKLMKNIKGYSGVIASRWKKGAEIKESFLRRIMSRGFNFLVRGILFLKYEDTQCGAKLFRKFPLSLIIGEITSVKWAFDVELLYRLKRKKCKIKEIPTIWVDKKDSQLNIIKAPIQMFFGIIRIRLMYSPLDFIVRFYNKLPERLKIRNF